MVSPSFELPDIIAPLCATDSVVGFYMSTTEFSVGNVLLLLLPTRWSAPWKLETLSEMSCIAKWWMKHRDRLLGARPWDTVSSTLIIAICLVRLLHSLSSDPRRKPRGLGRFLHSERDSRHSDCPWQIVASVGPGRFLMPHPVLILWFSDTLLNVSPCSCPRGKMLS